MSEAKDAAYVEKMEALYRKWASAAFLPFDAEEIEAAGTAGGNSEQPPTNPQSNDATLNNGKSEGDQA